MASYLFALYSKTVLQRPVVTLVITAAIAGFFLAHATDFELDASADSLILENDASLKYYRSIWDNTQQPNGPQILRRLIPECI